MNRHSVLRIVVLALFFAAAFSIVGISVHAQTTPAPIMVIAPHPDDEGLIASGVIYRQLQAGGRVKVVIMSNGDFQGQAKGLQREAESVAALAKLGLSQQDIIFLGYPDSRMGDILVAATDTQVFASADGTIHATYGNNGFGNKDWHTLIFGTPGPYTRQTLMTDVRSVIEAYRPTDIYTTAEIDVHADHNATYFFVHNALVQIAQELPTYQPKLHKTVVHDSVGPDAWPLPTTASGVTNRFDPTQSFTLPQVVQGSSVNSLVLERLAVPTPMLDTNSATNLKFQTLSQYVSQVTPFLFAFCKKDEFFWIDPPVTLAGSGGTSTNVALQAIATASSQNTSTGQTADKAIDGVISGYPNDSSKEWATNRGGLGSFLKLTWSTTQTINKIVLYDRPNLNDQVLSGTISFSDGSSIPVGTLNNDGSATTFNFTSRTITNLTFTVNNAAGSNIGLSEIQVFTTAGGGGPVITNNPPAITGGPTANPASVGIGSSTSLSVTAADADSNPLIYIWVPPTGIVTGSGPTVSYSNTATGSVRIQVIVIDSKNSATSGEVTVTITASGNRLPVISSEPISSPNELVANGTSSLSVVASDPDNDPLTYLWSSTDGTITGNGPTVSFKAPASSSDQIVTATVTINDGRGGVVTDNVVILVRAANHPPIITSKLVASPTTIASTATSTLTVGASDPDGDTLTFTWSTTAGTITGTGASVKLTPPKPKNSRNVVVTVTVSDGKGGQVTSSASITVTK